MLPVDFVGVPVVCQAVQHDFHHFGLRASNEWSTFARQSMCG